MMATTAPQAPAPSPASKPAWLDGNSLETYATASTTRPAQENISSHKTRRTVAPLVSECVKKAGVPINVAARIRPRYRGPVRSRIKPQAK